MAAAQPLPPLVIEAQQRAGRAGFDRSCEPAVGALLSCLTAAVPRGGRVLEIGTGVGVSLAWIMTGLGARTDVAVVTVERDPARVDMVEAVGWPSWVTPICGDIEELLPDLGQFELIFADAEGAKWTRLDLTLEALSAPAVLLVDDMDIERYEMAEHRSAVTQVRSTLHGDSRLVTVELAVASGVILASRRSQ